MRWRRTLAASASLVLLLTACEREQRRFREGAPAGGLSSPYDGNAWAISEGQRLYNWFNCNGCHAMGGGGMGPALMDDVWIYGSEPASIFASIVDGRPNGMPAFGGKVPEQQVWQLVAYVRTLSALQRKDVRPGRSDAMQARPAPVTTTPGTPIGVPPAAPPPPR
jgi:cytochrome c oxidase cbb3-type subunit 3